MRGLWIGLALALTTSSAMAARSDLIGTWRLKSFVRQVVGSGERYDQLGPHPQGFISYTADGHVSVLMVDSDVPGPAGDAPTEAERARMHATMIAYAGTYVVDEQKVIHHIEIAWNRQRIGEDQVRFYKITGTELTLTTAPNKSPVDGRQGIGVLVWQKVGPAPQ